VLRGALGAVKLGGAKPRRLLAALALNTGRVISADRLIDIAWGELPPRTARQNLHTYLWSLRRSLAAAAGPRLVIVERPPGYLLRAGPGALDLHRFRELCSAGRRCLPSDPVAGGTLLRQALGLWRGPALFDVADGLPQLAARLAAMEEERLTALEQRIRADLAAGRHGELVAELGELAAAYPFREQFLADQMVALYRCGRQAEALAAFHLLRERLADELGVDPSPGLSRLYVAMLRGDVTLDWPGAAPGRAYSAESKLTEL
jgi:DNA-binding SARP family transcriptional activator